MKASQETRRAHQFRYLHFYYLRWKGKLSDRPGLWPNFFYKFVDTTKAIKFNILIFKYVDNSIFPFWQCILFKAIYFSF